MGKFEINVDIKARELGLKIERLTKDLQDEFYQAVSNVAHGAYARIVSDAQQKLHDSRLDYLKGLEFQKLGQNSYLIELQGDYPQKLEEGYAAFDMKPGMLASDKTVEVGSRTGLPWVQKGAEGGKFAHVPFEHKPFSKAPRGKDLNQILRGVKVYNRQGLKQKITSVFKDASGNPLEGAVAKITDTGLVANLQQLTKFQKVVKTQAGKEQVKSLYLTWRTVSENSSGWVHPGHQGVKLFDYAQKYVEEELENIIKSFTE
jgi:hypothetical protein